MSTQQATPVQDSSTTQNYCFNCSQEAVKRFLKSVVVIDNEAYMGTTPAEGNSLDVEAVTRSFAQQGIICSVYRPRIDDQDIPASCIPLLQQADAAIIDWELTHDAERHACTEIIKRLFTKDDSRSSSISLVIIYTAETPSNVVDILTQHLSPFNFSPLNDNDEWLGLQNHLSKIICLQKKDENAATNPTGLEPSQYLLAKPSELPKHTIKAFSMLVDGLVPTIALHSIAVLRENAHAVLGTFNKDIDSSVLLHALYIPNKHDLKNFISGLIAKECMQIISSDRTIKKLAANDNIISFIKNHRAKSETIVCPTCDGSGSIDSECTKSSHGDKHDNCLYCRGTKKRHIPCTACKGRKKWEISAPLLERAFHKKSHLDKLPPINILINHLCPTSANNNSGWTKFVRLNTLSSEPYCSERQYTIPEIPILNQGTIICCEGPEGNEVYSVCIIAPCDAIRINSRRRLFPFIRCEVTTKDTDSDFIVLNKNRFICLKLPSTISWKSVIGLYFSSNDTIEAIKDGDEYIFKDIHHHEHVWIADLRPEYASRLAQQAMPPLARLGIDEFEGHRRLKDLRSK